MKNKLLNDVSAHYNLVNSKMSLETIKEQVKLALTDLYCTFCGLNSQVDGEGMVCQHY